MDKPRILLTCIVLSYFSPRLVTTSGSCWRKPPCTCFNKNRSIINCRNVQNVSDVIELLKNHSPIYRIRLKGNFTTIPSRAFDNISISVLWIESPLNSDIPNDSLSGIQNLRNVILNKTQYEKIPEVFSNQYYAEFQSSYGRLVTIETQLQNMSSATEIRLKKNHISSVSQEAFYGTSNIHLLDLSYNKLLYIHPETFETLAFLEVIYLQHNSLQMLDGCLHAVNPRVIDLYGNNLTNIDHVLHSGMWNLKYLNIGGNEQLEISSHSFNRSLKSLTELHLSHNNYTKLDPYLLKKLWGLHELYLNDNNLAYIPRYFFENNPFLNVLQLKNNRLTSIEEALRNHKVWYNWMKITLEGNRLKNIDFGRKHVKILILDVSRNQISRIKEKEMIALQNVSKLYLSHNGLSSLESKSFRNFHTLWSLDLSYNNFKHLNHSLQGLTKLYILNLNSVLLERISADDFLGTNRLKSLFLRNNSLQTVSGAFRHLDYLGILNLAMNNLTTLTVDSFPSFWNASIRIRQLWMADNPWTCDCRLAWMASWIQKRNSNLKDEPICASPEHLKNQTLRSLNLTDYVRWYDECPEVCECICQWDGNQIYTEADCIGRELNKIPKVFPSNLRTLDLSWNKIESFDSKEALGLENLEHLNLEHNNIREIRLTVFPPKLFSLRLAYNRLRMFPVNEWLVKNVSINQISLSHNPWACKCDAWSFRNWIVHENKTIVDVDQIRCDGRESFYLRNKLIISLTEKELCSLLSDIVIISICSALLLILGLLIFCYRHSLTALLYTWCCTCLKSTERHEYPYDAFLMYCEDDEQFAMGELSTILENSKYSFNLCIPNRDIPAPRTQQKINAYLPQCMKVLVLLTRSFIENQDCMRFLISAMSFSTESSAKCIIFVTKGKLPPAHELDPLLKTLLRSCMHLRWGQCLFWEKLIYQLPKKGKKKQEWDNVEEEPFLRSQNVNSTI